MMRGASVGAALLLAGCGQATAPVAVATVEPSRPAAAATSTPSPSPSAIANAPASLVGEWRVAGIDGKPVDAPMGIALSIDAKTIRFEPVCAGFSWNYTYQAGRLETWRSSEGPRPTPGAPPPPVCAVAVFPEQRALGVAIRAATRAVRTPSNGVELSGSGHSVTLFSQ